MGFSIGNALSGGIGGFLGSGGNPWGALAGAAGGLFSDLGEQQKNVQSSTGLPAWQLPYVQDVAKQAQNWYNRGGSRVADLSPETLSGWNMARNYAGNLGGIVNQGIAANLQGLSGTNPYANFTGQAIPGQVNYLQSIMGQQAPQLGGTNVAPNPYDAISQMQSGQIDMGIFNPLSQQIVQKGTQDFIENIMPSIRHEAQSYGQYGGPQHTQSLGLAADRASENIAQAQERLAGTAYQNALSQRAQGSQLGLSAAANQAGLQQNQTSQGLSAAGQLGSQFTNLYNPAQGLAANYLGMLPQTAQLGLLPSNIYQNIGGQRQAYEQSRLDAPLQSLQGYQGLVSGNYGMTQNTPYFRNNLQTGLGLGMMALPYLQNKTPSTGIVPGDAFMPGQMRLF